MGINTYSIPIVYHLYMEHIGNHYFVDQEDKYIGK